MANPLRPERGSHLSPCRSSACGSPSPAPRSRSGCCSILHYSSARRLQTRVQTPRPQGWADSSASPMADRHALRRHSRQYCCLTSFLGSSPQHCVAAWVWTLSRLLPPGHAPVHVVFRTDNSPSQSAAWKADSCERHVSVSSPVLSVAGDCPRFSPPRLCPRLPQRRGRRSQPSRSACHFLLPANRSAVRAVVLFPGGPAPHIFPDALSYGGSCCSLRLSRAQILMAISPLGRALAQWSWIFRHQNSVPSALPVGLSFPTVGFLPLCSACMLFYPCAPSDRLAFWTWSRSSTLSVRPLPAIPWTWSWLSRWIYRV